MSYTVIALESNPTGARRVRVSRFDAYPAALRYVSLIVSIARGAGHTLTGSIANAAGKQLAVFATDEPDDQS